MSETEPCAFCGIAAGVEPAAFVHRPDARVPGKGADQEVPHLHVHVHPRIAGDGALRIYPSPPALPERAVLDARAERIRLAIAG